MKTYITRFAITAITAVVACAAMLASAAASANPSTEVKVIGAVKPTACTPILGAGNNVVEYGLFSRAQLNKGSFTRLETKEIEFAINCDGAVLFGVKLTDNRASSKVAGLATQLSHYHSEATMYGLGNAGSAKIGAFHLDAKRGSFLATNASGASQSVDLVVSHERIMWHRLGGGMVADMLLAWAPRGYHYPLAYRSLTGKLAVTPVLNKPEDLPLNQEINMDGSATIEVVYL